MFNCECGHEFEASLNKISTENTWCPYCCFPPLKLCNNDCNNCLDKSFASHKKSKYWSNKNKLNPRDVFKSAKNKYIFNCECGHEFEASLNNINTHNKWCPYCSNPSQKLCDNIICNLCFNNSFASNEKSNNIIDKNKFNARFIFKSCSTKINFLCDNCNHTFEKTTNGIYSKNEWCPYCANKKLCDQKDCKYCLNKSFESHEKSKYWSNKNKLNPRDVFKSANNKYIFNCIDCNNEFSTILYNITNKYKPTWCPFCKNKTELKLYNEIVKAYNLKKQYKIEWCKKKSYLPFDFCIEENKIIIELDGPQHFKQVSNWSSPEEQFENDKYKQKCANENGYSIIRLLQEDVFNDKYDWKTELIDNIEKLKIDNIIQNIYMCKNNEYEHFIK